VPEGYTGDTASIDDSFKRTGRTKAQIYYVKLIDGKEIGNAMVATNAATFGKGPEIHREKFELNRKSSISLDRSIMDRLLDMSLTPAQIISLKGK